MQLPSSGGRTRTIQQKNMSTGKLAPAERRGAPAGVMVFALLDDFVNLKDLRIKHDGKNPRHHQAAATCTYRRTLGLIAAVIIQKIQLGSELNLTAG
jgi:hypothetical protein